MDVRTEAVWKVEARLLDDRLNGTTNLMPTWPEDEEPKPGIKPAAVTTSPSGVRRIAAPRCTPLDLLRLQAITNDSPPRGLLLVVGCVGVLLNLTDTLPSWDGCKSILKGQRTPSLSNARRRRLQAAGAAVQQGVGFWQLLENFDPSAVTAQQRETVLNAVRNDAGGLMLPHHLEQVGVAAAALGAWVQAAHELLKAPPPPPPPPPPAAQSSLFSGPQMAICPHCNIRLEERCLAEHAVMCAAKQREREQSIQQPVPLRPYGISESERAGMAALAADRVQSLRLSDSTYGPLPEPRVAPPQPSTTPALRPPPSFEPRVLSSPRRQLSPPTAPPPPPPAVESKEEPPAAVPGFDYLRSRTGSLMGLPVAPPSMMPSSGDLGRPRQQRQQPQQGRRAKPKQRQDEDDDEEVVVMSREAHVAAVHKKLGERGVDLGFGRAIAPRR